MKKLMAILLTLCFLAAACPVLADSRTAIADTGLTVTIPSELEELELTEDDIEEGVFAIYIDEEETLSMTVGAYEDQLAIEELKAYLEEEEEGEYSFLDFTTINGITAVCEVCPEEDDDGFFVIYWFSDEKGIVFIEFWCQDDAAAERSRVIMESLA